MGYSVTVLSILRLRTLVVFAKHENLPWEYTDMCIWSILEVGMALVAACLPNLRLLLIRLFPRLAGSSHRSENSYERNQGVHKSFNRFRRHRDDTTNFGLRGHSVHVVAENNRSTEAEPKAGIRQGKSYIVQYSDNDETSLVGMTDLGSKNT